jgi:hypothetical protein
MGASQSKRLGRRSVESSALGLLRETVSSPPPQRSQKKGTKRGKEERRTTSRDSDCDFAEGAAGAALLMDRAGTRGF